MFLLIYFVFLQFPLIFTEEVQITHSDNWAVLVGTSRFWFNYRHIANVLGIYHILKRNGLSDDHIILMLPEDVACNPRNRYPGQVFNHVNHKLNLYSSDIEIDFRGYEVTVDNFIRVLLDRQESVVPKHKRMRSDSHSNVLIYITGHGGDEFVKFQDSSEITAQDIADVMKQMEWKGRFHQALLLLDSCQASTFFQRIDSAGVITGASSSIKESSYSHTNDYDIGVSVIDRFTYYTLEYFRKITKDGKDKDWWNKYTLDDLFRTYDPAKLNAHPKFTDSSFKGVKETLLSDFFGKNIIIDFEFEKETDFAFSKVNWNNLEVKKIHDGNDRAIFLDFNILELIKEECIQDRMIWFALSLSMVSICFFLDKFIF